MNVCFPACRSTTTDSLGRPCGTCCECIDSTDDEQTLERSIGVNEEANLMELRTDLSDVFDGDENMLVVFHFADDSFNPGYFGLLLFLKNNVRVDNLSFASTKSDED
jgi:hypothetical protein